MSLFDCTSPLAPYTCFTCTRLPHTSHQLRHYTEIYSKCCIKCKFYTYSHLLLLHHRQFCTNFIESPSPNRCNWHSCDFCPAEFKLKSTLAHHICCKHAKNKFWFKCEQCDEKYQTKWHLERHMVVKHPMGANVKRRSHILYNRRKILLWFKCAKCVAKFKTTGDLKKHMKACSVAPLPSNYHIRSEVKVIESATAQSPISLILYKHKNLNKWFKCGECAGQFQTMNALRKHSELKCKMKWFYCEQCKMKFPRNESLHIHSARTPMDDNIY